MVVVVVGNGRRGEEGGREKGVLTLKRMVDINSNTGVTIGIGGNSLT
jgi:hypothetical protein